MDKDRADIFNHTVAKMLFMSTRYWRDINTSVLFLTIRGKHSDEDDWGKLKKLLKLLKGTKYMKFMLRVDSLEAVRWCIDTLYNTHGNFRVKHYVMMSLGWG